MTDAVYAGGCLCGAVRYQLTGTVSNPCYCHCVSCRRAAGAPMVPWGTFARAALRITHGTLTEFSSSPRVRRGFCPRCGTSLTYRHEARSDEIDVTLASLDDPTLIEPTMHVWVADRLPWMRIEDGLPQHQEGASGAPQSVKEP
jgi:hypothetical protein